jgi:hypothetical protein
VILVAEILELRVSASGHSSPGPATSNETQPTERGEIVHAGAHRAAGEAREPDRAAWLDLAVRPASLTEHTELPYAMPPHRQGAFWISRARARPPGIGAAQLRCTLFRTLRAGSRQV